MYLRKDDKGFIFSLDATLAILVGLIALASVASVGSSSTTYEHFGRLRLQRTGQDAITILTLKDSFENAVLAMEAADYDKAERILRDNLKEILPEHIQFKLYIRDQLSVYPTDNSGWGDLYENIEDKTVTNLLYAVPSKENYFRILTWTPETREETFVDNISNMRPLWYIKKTTNETNFRENVAKKDDDGNDYEFFDVVFIPDADIQFSEETINDLKSFATHGRLVVAGDTLYNNQDTVNPNATNFTETFGIHDWDDDSGGHDIRKQDRNNLEDDIDPSSPYYSYPNKYFSGLKMYAQPINASTNLDNPILYGFTPIDNLGYAGDNVYTYEDYYDLEHLEYGKPWDWFMPNGGTHEHDSGVDIDTSTAKVLTNWGHYPEDQCLDLCGLITNDTDGGAGVFIGANIAQNVVDKNESPYKWLRLTANSISGSEGYELFYDPITLSLWKGEGL